jgi:hypothetical protein
MGVTGSVTNVKATICCAVRGRPQCERRAAAFGWELDDCFEPSTSIDTGVTIADFLLRHLDLLIDEMNQTSSLVQILKSVQRALTSDTRRPNSHRKDFV